MKLTEKEVIRQNMIDAGCDDCTITAFMSAMEKGKTAESIKILDKYRHGLLDDVHQGEDKINRVDYLIYQLRKADRY